MCNADQKWRLKKASQQYQHNPDQHVIKAGKFWRDQRCYCTIFIDNLSKLLGCVKKISKKLSGSESVRSYLGVAKYVTDELNFNNNTSITTTTTTRHKLALNMLPKTPRSSKGFLNPRNQRYYVTLVQKSVKKLLGCQERWTTSCCLLVGLNLCEVSKPASNFPN